MGKVGDSANPEKPGPPPQLSEPLKILRILLNQNLARLQAARKIEAAREFVFPETTVIMRDIWKYTQEIERRTAPETDPAAVASPPEAAAGSSDRDRRDADLAQF